MEIADGRLEITIVSRDTENNGVTVKLGGFGDGVIRKQGIRVWVSWRCGSRVGCCVRDRISVILMLWTVGSSSNCGVGRVRPTVGFVVDFLLQWKSMPGAFGTFPIGS